MSTTDQITDQITQFHRRMLVHYIRTVCEAELGRPYDYPFFWQSYDWTGAVASSDEALVAIFFAERPHHSCERDTVLVMCHG